MILAVSAFWVVQIWWLGKWVWRRRSTHRRTWAVAWGYAIMWMLWWTMMAPLVQVWWIGKGEGDPLQFVVLYFSWFIQMGGATVTELYESTVGDRSDVLASHFGHYLLWWVVQTAVISILLAARLRRSRRLRDPVWIAAGILLAVNALANIDWDWWGT